MGGSAEADAFDYFRRYTTVKMPGVFESAFWDTLVLQLSAGEPAILHAAAAMGAAHRSDERLSLEQYNKAISFLRPHLESHEQDGVRVALITCMIFICLELLRGDFEVSNKHLRNGLGLLREFQSRKGLTPAGGALVLRPEPTLVDDQLVEAFARLHIQSALLGQGSSYRFHVGDTAQGPWTYNIPSRFENFREARQQLDGLLNGVTSLEGDALGLLHQQNPIPDVLFRRREQLQEALARWLPAFDLGRAAMEARATSRTALAVPLLRLYHTMTTVMAGTCLRGTDEMVYDSYSANFDLLISQALELYHRATTELIDPTVASGHHIPTRHFTVDMGFIPPLYYAALKCRSPGIRRRAIKLLLPAPHREGVWDGGFAARIAQQVAKMEEGPLYDPIQVVLGTGFPDIETLAEPGPPIAIPSHARVNEVRVALPSEAGKMATLTFKRFRSADSTWETTTSQLDLLFDAPSNPCRTCRVDLYA